MAPELLHTSSGCAAPKYQPQPSPVLTTGLLRGAADRLTRSLHAALSLLALSHSSTMLAPMTKMLHEFLQAMLEFLCDTKLLLLEVSPSQPEFPCYRSAAQS